MITTLTAANCFEDAGFCQWWDQAESVRFDHYNFLPIMDDGFLLDCLIDAYSMGQDSHATIKSIADDWDPTPETAYDWFH